MHHQSADTVHRLACLGLPNDSSANGISRTMLINASVFRRLPYRIRRRMKFNVRVTLEDRELTIPTSLIAGMDNVSWTRSWRAELIERLIESDRGLFVDAGANVGQTLLDLKLMKPDYSWIGFEPNIACVSYLKELIHVNAFEECRIIPVGLSDRAACLPLFRHKDESADSNATIIPNLRPDRLYDIDMVPCFTFDEVMQSLSVGKIDFIKIDIEGAELEALTGMEMSIRALQPVILCEVLFTDSKGDLTIQGARNAKVMELLLRFGYKVLQLLKSDDVTTIVGVRGIQTFPSGYWDRDNKDLCDYLFYPAARETEILRCFP
jgi:FkbM family methyltransferase